MAEPPVLVLLLGLPGSGKTTLGRRLEVELPALRLASDEWLEALGLDLFDDAARAAVEARLHALAEEVLRLGTSVVLEPAPWQRAGRDQLRAAAGRAGARVELRFLEAPLDELERRVAGRALAGGAPIERRHLEAWLPLLERPGPDELA